MFHLIVFEMIAQHLIGKRHVESLMGMLSAPVDVVVALVVMNARVLVVLILE